MQRFFSIITVVFLSLAIASCAKQGMPSGGPKDVTPPRALHVSPGNGSLHFKGNTFTVEFDEYVVLKDADNNILVSPPLANKPEYKTKGRKVVVTFSDTLQPNATYLFQFKNAVADFNEGNLLPSFEVVFATGDVLDSMTIGGLVLDALTQQPRKEMLTLMLFDASVPLQQLTAAHPDSTAPPVSPRYVTRCDSSGHFAFNYIREGRYHVVALEDGDKNLKVGTNEAVAFTNSPVVPHHAADTTAAHTALQMMLFEPKHEVQRLTGSTFLKAGKVQLTTLIPMEQPTLYADGEEVRWQLNARRDTLTLWTLREKCDSLRLIVSDPSGIQDTLKLRFRAKPSRVAAVAKPSPLTLQPSHKSLPFFDTLRLVADVPLDPARCSADSVVAIRRMKDSTVTRCPLVSTDNLLQRAVLFPFQQGEKYELLVPAKAVGDIYGHSNDSLTFPLTVIGADQYGNLKITLVPDSSCSAASLIVEVVDEKNHVVARQRCGADATIEFRNLAPTKYRIRAIFDDNGNGQWDTGDYNAMTQPEGVRFMPKTINIRANWDFEETWQLSRHANKTS